MSDDNGWSTAFNHKPTFAEQRVRRKMLTAQRGRRLTQLRLIGRPMSKGGAPELILAFATENHVAV